MKDLHSRWFAVMVKPRFEKSVSSILRAKGYEEFLPVSVERKEWSDRWKLVEFPLFPRYLFCRFGFHERVPVLNTPGVLRIVGTGPLPCHVPDHEIDALRVAIQARVPLQHCEYFAYGQPIKIVKGPLTGTQGFFVETKGDSRVVLTVHLLQRSVYAEVDKNSTVPVDLASLTSDTFGTVLPEINASRVRL